ncbi:MAG TPA: YggT family protein [Syntrophales bacterium]|nr:YggT family protein [Syntrophales bacterium]HOL59911.1 YggT family protein [Syntrophales bacterium]HPO36058.1 YggT family protein [Syntrophales bacterium]
MFVLANFLIALARVIDVVLTIYLWIVIVSAVISWVNPDPYNPIVRFLRRVTEPILSRLRRLLPLTGLGIDFSPVVLILIIYFLQWFLVKSLIQLATRL